MRKFLCLLAAAALVCGCVLFFQRYQIRGLEGLSIVPRDAPPETHEASGPPLPQVARQGGNDPHRVVQHPGVRRKEARQSARPWTAGRHRPPL